MLLASESCSQRSDVKTELPTSNYNHPRWNTNHRSHKMDPTHTQLKTVFNIKKEKWKKRGYQQHFCLQVVVNDMQELHVES